MITIEPEHISDYSNTGLNEHISEIDKAILELINRRLRISERMGKSGSGAVPGVMNSMRLHDCGIQQLIELNQGPLKSGALRHIFTEIHSASCEIQAPTVVSYLGPEATFTHMAAINYFGSSVKLLPQTSIRDIFLETEKRRSRFGVVPVENSIEGSVNYTLDLFFESDLKICAELYLPISHLLLSNEDDLRRIEVVYSHPQAFAQCRAWLRQHLPNAVLEHCSSTSDAAKRASRQPASAAVAGKAAAEFYQLRVLASAIEDTCNNVTRFLVIGRSETHASGNDKTSLLFVTGHTPGALYKVLTPLAEAGVNMLKLESRPVKHQSWNYVFFVDLDGHMDDPVVLHTVEQMKQQCMYLKCLGSYAKGEKKAEA